MTRQRQYLFAMLASLADVSPALAHHSFSMFDQTRLLPIQSATVTRFVWTNPHSFVVVEVDGIRYVLECNSINLMTKAGWKHNMLKAGDKVRLVYYPLRDGKPGGMLKTITLPNGKTLPAW
jgi:hypothetical protein